jgi:hypothetical protein
VTEGYSTSNITIFDTKNNSQFQVSDGFLLYC